MADFMIYRTLSNPYYQLVQVAKGEVWDVSAGALAAAPTYANTDIALTVNAFFNGYPVTLPSTLPAGEYDFLLKEGASPDNADVTVLGKRIRWDGSNLLGLPMDL